MKSKLENLSGPGRSLQKEPPDIQEFRGLIAPAMALLDDAKRPENSVIGQFDLAYNAAYSLSLAALRWHGYRPSNRYIVFQVLPHTLSIEAPVWRLLDKCHGIRNRRVYEGYLEIDHQLVQELIQAAEEVAEALDALPDIQK